MPIYTLKLIDRQEIARNTVQLSFEKPKGFTFLAGQYGGFTLINPQKTDASGITRRFSLLASPNDETLQIATRVRQSAFKQILTTMPLGSEIKFAGPTGNFTLHEEAHIPAVMIAGGIGIVPFYSIIRYVTQQRLSHPIILFYGNQTTGDSALLDELNELARQNSNFSLVNTINDADASWQGERGYVTDEMIAKYVKDLDAPIYYVCGSPAMVSAMQETLAELGIHKDRIRVEDFAGY